MQLDWWTLALQAVNFLVLVWLLRRFLYRPVQQVIARRQALSEQAMDEARRKAEEADAARQRLEASRAALEAEKRGIVEQVHKDMQAERQSLLDAARSEADHLLQDAKAAAEKDHARTLAGLRDDIADLAAGIASQVLTSTGAERLGPGTLAAARAHFEDMPDSQLEELRRDLETRTEGLELVTAEALDEADQIAWRDGLRGWLRSDCPVTFATDPGILGGIELRFPHAILDFSWAGRIRDTTEQMIGPGDEQ